MSDNNSNKNTNNTQINTDDQKKRRPLQPSNIASKRRGLFDLSREKKH